MRLTLRARLAAIVSLCLLLIIAAVGNYRPARCRSARAKCLSERAAPAAILFTPVPHGEQSATLFDALRYWTDSSEVEKRGAHCAVRSANQRRSPYRQQLAFDARTKPLSQRFLTHLDGWQVRCMKPVSC